MQRQETDTVWISKPLHTDKHQALAVPLLVRFLIFFSVLFNESIEMINYVLLAVLARVGFKDVLYHSKQWWRVINIFVL